MDDADYLSLLTRQAEQANDLLSNARKWERTIALFTRNSATISCSATCGHCLALTTGVSP